MPSHNKPPAGYRPIPNSRAGGYVKGEGRDARYWYPDRRAATQAAADIVGRVTLHAKRAHAAGLRADSTGDPKHSETWAAMQNQAARAYQEELPGHVAEIERHLKAEQASLGRGRGGGRVRAASELPNRKAMQQELIAAHQAEGTATPIGRERPGQYTVPYVATPHAMGTTPLDVSSANDAQLLLAYAGTAVRHTKHAARLSAAIYGDSPMSKSAPSPPPGYTPIPESASGGYHRRTAKGWVHWYPSREAARTAFRDHDHKAGKMLEAAARVRDIDADAADALAKEGRRHHRLSEAAQRAAFDPDYEAPIEVGGHMVTPDSPAHEHAREAAHTRQGADEMRRAAPRFVHPEGRREAEREAGQYEARHTAALHRLQRAEGYYGEVGADHRADPDPEHTALLRGRARLNRRLGEIVASARSNGDRSTEARLEAVRGYLPEGRPGGGPNSPSSTPPRDLRKALAVLARAAGPQLV